MKKVIIIGTGGHAKVIADIIQQAGDEVAGFLDPSMDVGSDYLGFPVLGNETDDYETYKNLGYYFIIGIGSNKIRKRIDEQLSGPWYTAIHPAANVAHGSQIGEGSAIMAGAVVNPDSSVGRHCIINTLASIDHDNQLKDYSHVSPHGALAGSVSVGCMCHIGVGASIIDGISICDNVVVGAGSVVIRDIVESGTYVSVPARKIK